MPEWLRLTALALAAVVVTLVGAVLVTAGVVAVYVWMVL